MNNTKYYIDITYVYQCKWRPHFGFQKQIYHNSDGFYSWIPSWSSSVLRIRIHRIDIHIHKIPKYLYFLMSHTIFEYSVCIRICTYPSYLTIIFTFRSDQANLPVRSDCSTIIHNLNWFISHFCLFVVFIIDSMFKFLLFLDGEHDWIASFPKFQFLNVIFENVRKIFF